MDSSFWLARQIPPQREEDPRGSVDLVQRRVDPRRGVLVVLVHGYPAGIATVDAQLLAADARPDQKITQD